MKVTVRLPRGIARKTISMQASLKDFLATGRLGVIQVGMSRSQIYEIVGSPDDTFLVNHIRIQDIPVSPIWKYGDIDFHFEETTESLFLIHLDGFSIPSGGVKIQLDPWIVQHSLSIQEFTQQAAAENITYRIGREHYDDENTIRLTLQSGVKLLFTSVTQQYGPLQGLNAVSLLKEAVKRDL